MVFPRSHDVNTDVATRDFKYYIFDWDDNILHMPTKIHLEKFEEETGTWKAVRVSTAVFAVVRTDEKHYRIPLEGGRKEAFREFADDPGETGDQAFIRDTKAALARMSAGEKPGPSFETLRKTLIEGRIFAIVTARGHASETIRQAVRLFIDAVLTASERREMMANLRGYRAVLDKVESFGTDDEELDYYLSMCRYHAVTHEGFRAEMEKDAAFGARLTAATGAQKPELAKEFAIRDFVDHVFHMLRRTGGFETGRSVSIGFSDDDPGNVKAVSEYIRSELAAKYPGFKFVVYDTSDPDLSFGRKLTVSGQLDLPGF